MQETTFTCEWCRRQFTKAKARADRPPRFCDRSCSAKWRMSRPEYVATLNTEKRRVASQENMRRLRQRPDVQEKLTAHLSGETNPFRDPAVQAKSRAVRREQGYPMLTGGNGRGPSAPQALLAARLGWPMEIAIPTKRGRPYPKCYKVDIGLPELRIAIEVDGESHNSAVGQARDAKKDALLTELGWRVLRFPNRRVLRETDAVVAEVLAVVRSTTSRPGPATT